MYRHIHIKTVQNIKKKYFYYIRIGIYIFLFYFGLLFVYIDRYSINCGQTIKHLITLVR
jgi:hypothetical protein